MQQLPKHISVLTDFGFKKMFGEANKRFLIALLNSILPIFRHPDRFFYEVQLKNQYNEVFLPKFKLYFIELCTFARLIEESELGSDMERWLYIIKNIGTDNLQECPFSDPIFQDFFEQGQTEKLTPMEKEDYKKSIFDYQDVQTTIQYERELAMAEGRAKGMAEGVAKEKLAMAKSLLEQGVGLEIIIKTTGLSAEEICG